MSLIDTILGRPLASSEAGEQRIGPAAGVPTFGLDALSSAAYGPEAALTVLLPLGAAGLTFIFPITVAIVISARHRLRQLPANYRGVSERRRLLYGRARKPRHERQSSGRRRPDDGLRAECRGWNFSRHRRVDLSRAGPSALHANAMSRNFDSADLRE